MKNQSKFVRNAEELRNELRDQKISQPTFAERYYLDEVDEKAGEDKLYSHCERFKSLLKSTDQRSPERVAAYINYFNRHYRKEGKYTQADRYAAWAMYIELDTRIATKTLQNGKTDSALESLASLFAIHRCIAKENGPNCRNYFALVNNVLEAELRPFTSKWHAIAHDIDDALFRPELEAVQEKLTELKDKLHEISD
ncbi:hypothetical protein [Vibrio fluminensis]|uniref:hypothetical protein n=1 Tax=Vibrio fluminensis TaxID=2783614 RepID=UPI001886F158|nr:hypothetical protein [Vibrio fluminensis]